MLQDGVLLFRRFEFALHGGQLRLVAFDDTLFFQLSFRLVVQHEFLHELVPIGNFSRQVPNPRRQLLVLVE